MLQRFFLEVTQSPDSRSPERIALYDYDDRRLLNEIDGEAWRKVLEHLDTSEEGVLHTTTLDGANDLRTRDRNTQPAANPDADTSGLAEPAGAIELYRPPEEALDPVKAARRKLWEIPHKYHCPIIGTCLTVEELRRIGKRFVWSTKERLSDYEIHVGFVSAAEERNGLSLATQKLLDKKYASAVRRYGKAKDQEAILALWSESLACGEVTSGLWALMTHAKTDAATMVLAYEDIHMLSHQIGAGQRADLKRLSETRIELSRVRHEFETFQRRTAQQTEQRERTISDLERALSDRQDDCTRLEQENERLQRHLAASGTSDLIARTAALSDAHALAQSRLEEALSTSNALRQKLNDAEKRAAGLEIQLAEREAERESLERLLALNLDHQCEACPNDSCACRADLAGQLVLCVGGRKPLVEQYRQLVNSCNGRFEHHDGGLEDSHRRLETMLASADAIVCAADYVSHNAYYRTKRFCKRLDKPHVLLGNSGLSSFARALEQVAN
ncbi:DUF2325 domain-containing protein [Thiorhodococcus fuscus]|uniref:DUF2325 domain-containing protein n=1 Tax=Thiorhodococcus fuscus TaxID=527200 RepID=A0ABW4Y5H5_9GAMM